MPSFCQHPADLRTAAVHDDRLDARLLEQHDVLGEILRGGTVAHGVAAIFDHHDLLVVALHVRQGLDEDFGAHVHVREAGRSSGSLSDAGGGTRRLLAQVRGDRKPAA